MQVTETLTEGLKREFRVTVPAADLDARVTGRLTELKDTIQLRGFRPESSRNAASSSPWSLR